MNESDRNEPVLYDHHFENFDYYTDFSETPDSITSTSQFTNNDCMMNNVAGEIDNNNNIDGAQNASSKSKEVNDQLKTETADSDWLKTSNESTMAIKSTKTTMSKSKETTDTTTTSSSTASVAATSTTTPTNTAYSDSKEEHSNGDSYKAPDENDHSKKNDLPSATKLPAKLSANKKSSKNKKVRPNLQ